MANEIQSFQPETPRNRARRTRGLALSASLLLLVGTAFIVHAVAPPGDTEEDLAAAETQATCFGSPATRPGSLTGTEGDDVIIGTTRRDVIDGLGGNDKICGAGGDDAIFGRAGNDKLSGGPGNDSKIDGGPGSDRLEGGRGDDVLRGGNDDDNLLGGPGADDLDGEKGADRLNGGSGAGDKCVGGVDADEDTADAANCEMIVAVP